MRAMTVGREKIKIRHRAISLIGDGIEIRMNRGTAKILLFLIVSLSFGVSVLFLSQTVKAPLVSTVYDFNQNTNTANFKVNILGVNYTLGSIQLLNSACISPVGQNNCFADIQFFTPYSFTGISVLGNAIPDVVDKSLGFNIVKGNISNYTFVTWQAVQDRADNITDMNTTCSDPNNIRTCTGSPIGWHWHNTTKQVEVPLFSNPSLALQNGKFRIYGTIPNGGSVDWIASFFGLTVPQFGWWNTSWNQTDNYTVTPSNTNWDNLWFNTTCGKEFNSSLDCKDIRFVSPTGVQFPTFLYSNSSFNSSASNATFLINISGYTGLSSFTMQVLRNNSNAPANSQDYNISQVAYFIHTARYNNTGWTNDFGTALSFNGDNSINVTGVSGGSAPIVGNFTFNYLRFEARLGGSQVDTNAEIGMGLSNNTLNNPCTNCYDYRTDMDTASTTNNFDRENGGFWSTAIITGTHTSGARNIFNVTILRNATGWSYYFNDTVDQMGILIGTSSDSLYNQTGFTRVSFMNGRANTLNVTNITLTRWNDTFPTYTFSVTSVNPNATSAVISFSLNSSTSPASYSNALSTWTINVNNQTNPINFVPLLQLNYSGALVNYTSFINQQNTTNTNATFNLTLPAGVTSYRWYMNDSANTQNSTALLTLSISKASATLNTFINGNPSNQTTVWLNNVNVSTNSTVITCSDCVFSLYNGTVNLINGSSVWNQSQYASGTYNIQYNQTNSSATNYTTSGNTSLYLIVNKAWNVTNNTQANTTYGYDLSLTGQPVTYTLSVNSTNTSVTLNQSANITTNYNIIVKLAGLVSGNETFTNVGNINISVLDVNSTAFSGTNLTGSNCNITNCWFNISTLNANTNYTVAISDLPPSYNSSSSLKTVTVSTSGFYHTLTSGINMTNATFQYNLSMASLQSGTVNFAVNDGTGTYISTGNLVDTSTCSSTNPTFTTLTVSGNTWYVCSQNQVTIEYIKVFVPHFTTWQVLTYASNAVGAGTGSGGGGGGGTVIQQITPTTNSTQNSTIPQGATATTGAGEPALNFLLTPQFGLSVPLFVPILGSIGVGAYIDSQRISRRKRRRLQ